MALIDKLKAIANAIRGRTDKTELMTLDQMSEEISEITTLKKLFDFTHSSRSIFAYYDGINIPDKLIKFNDTSNVSNMSAMFSNCPNLTTAPLIDTSNVTNMNSMFYNDPKLTDVPLYDTSKVTDMTTMFSACKSLTTIPLFNTSNVTSMHGMFLGCENLTTVPLFDISKAKDSHTQMFCRCKKLTNIPLFDFSNYTRIDAIFESCESLTTVPLFDFSNITILDGPFKYCKSLTTVPLFDTSNVEDVRSLFYGCTNLTTVPELDFRKCTSFSYPFWKCSSLTECWIKNINTDLQVGNGTVWGHLLTVESLLHLIKELIINEASYTNTLTIGSANLEKLANIYVRKITVTDEMRAEDDLIDSKLPFEVCSSADSGAMSINQYIRLKNWTIK